MAAVRAAAWANTMGRLGVHLPLFVVHDVGLFLTAPRGAGGVQLGAREPLLGRFGPGDERARSIAAIWRAARRPSPRPKSSRRRPAWRLRDDLVAVLLTKILGDVYHRWQRADQERRRRGAAARSADLRRRRLWRSTFATSTPRPSSAFCASSRRSSCTSTRRSSRSISTRCDCSACSTAAPTWAAASRRRPIDLVDLFGVFQSAEANDVVNFSLELLPSVLETKRASGVQTFAVDGYAADRAARQLRLRSC